MIDHEYEVEHNKRNRPEIPRGGGGKKKNVLIVRSKIVKNNTFFLHFGPRIRISPHFEIYFSKVLKESLGLRVFY